MNIKKLPVPDIGIGTWAFGGDYWGDQKHSDTIKAIHCAIRENLTLFDTAPVYGKGRSELVLGQQLHKNRSYYIISTKCFIKPVKQFIKSFENSLKRLNTDYIDIFYIHWPSTTMDSRPIVEELEKLKSKGYIKNIGLSNFNKEQLKVAQEAGKIDIVQNAFNFFWLNDLDYFKYCHNNNIATQAYSVLAQGLLTGKFSYDNPYSKKDMRYKMTLFNEENKKIIYNTLELLRSIAEKERLSIYELIILWTRSKSFLDSIIIGCRNRNQVESLVKPLKKNLSIETIDELNKISRKASMLIKGGENIFNHFY